MRITDWKSEAQSAEKATAFSTGMNSGMKYDATPSDAMSASVVSSSGLAMSSSGVVSEGERETRRLQNSLKNTW